jgi:hypothetical protein
MCVLIIFIFFFFFFFLFFFFFNYLSISFTEFAQALNSSDQEKEDGNFFCGGGRHQPKKARGMQVKIGRRRLHLMLLDKIEQKAKSNSSFARKCSKIQKNEKM